MLHLALLLHGKRVLTELLLRRLSYKGLGEPLCFLAFGPLATSAFFVAQVRHITACHQGCMLAMTGGNLPKQSGYCQRVRAAGYLLVTQCRSSWLSLLLSHDQVGTYICMLSSKVLGWRHASARGPGQAVHSGVARVLRELMLCAGWVGKADRVRQPGS